MAETVGMRIEAIAKAKGLPPGAKLAALFGVTYETLRKWRSGDSAPNRARQERVAEVLAVKPEVFMHGLKHEEIGSSGNEAVQARGAPAPTPLPTPTLSDQALLARFASLSAQHQGVVEHAMRKALDEMEAIAALARESARPELKSIPTTSAGQEFEVRGAKTGAKLKQPQTRNRRDGSNENH